MTTGKLDFLSLERSMIKFVSDPTGACKSNRHSLQDNRLTFRGKMRKGIFHTKAALLIAGTSVFRPEPWSLGTMDVWVVLVTYFVEEVNLISSRKERSSDAVNGCVTPTLQM